MLLCSAACGLLSPRALVLSCSHGFVLSCSGVAMPSRYCAPARSHRKRLITLRFIIRMVSCLICSESVAALFSIPRESIRSLSNSLPALARTGFQNRAPTKAKRSVFLRKGSPKPRTSPRTPEELPRPIQEPHKKPQVMSKKLQEDPKDAPRAPKEVS